MSIGAAIGGSGSIGGSIGVSIGGNIGVSIGGVVGSRKDPYTAFNFLVEIDSLLVAGFTEVTGLQVETEIEERREGGVNYFVHKLLKTTKYPNLVLKRGLTDSDELWNWYQGVAAGNIVLKNGSIILQDIAGNEAWRWNFIQGYPVKWTGPDLRSQNSAIAVETLELAHMGLVKGGTSPSFSVSFGASISASVGVSVSASVSL
jgi:phage tail-like protein